MATIRPTLTNWLSGYISRDLAGRSDLSLLLTGAYSLRNMITGAYGEVKKSGGLRNDVYWVDDKKFVILKWEINEDIDVLVVIAENSIKFINVVNGVASGFLQSSGTDIELTDYPISESDLDSIDYSTNRNIMLIVHENFKPIRLDFSSYVDGEFVFSHGNLSISGVILNVDMKIDTSNEMQDIGVSELNDIFSDIDVYDDFDEEYTATGTISLSGIEYDITKIRYQCQIEQSYIDQKGGAWIDYSAGYASSFDIGQKSTGGVTDNSNHFPEKTYIGRRKDRWDRGNLIAHNYDFTIKDLFSKTFSTSDTSQVFLNWAASNLENGQTYYFSRYNTYQDSPLRIHFYKFRYHAYTKTPTYTIYYMDGATEKTHVITSGTTVSMAIAIQNVGSTISGEVMGMNNAYNSIAPWIEMDEEYSCEDGSIINGLTVQSVCKRILNGNLVIVFKTEGDLSEIVISTNSDQYITGEVDINLTPMQFLGLNPGSVVFAYNRLLLGCKDHIYMSKVNEFQNFAYFEQVEYTDTKLLPIDEWIDQDGDSVADETYNTTVETVNQIGPDSAIRIRLSTNEDENIKWIQVLDRIYVGTATSEWVIPAGFDATNVRAGMVSRYGSSGVKPRFFGTSLVFVSSSKRRLFMINANAPSGAIDILEHAWDLVTGDIVSIDYRQDPHQELYVVLSDGSVLIGRQISESMFSWGKCIDMADNDNVLSVSVMQCGEEDGVFFAVSRPWGDGNVMSVERLTTPVDSVFSGRHYLDSYSYTSTPGNSLINLDRFEGRDDVYGRFLLADGSEAAGLLVIVADAASTYHPDDEEDGAEAIAIPSFLEAYVGYRRDYEFETARIDTVETDSILKSVGQTAIRVLNSGLPTGIQEPVGYSYPFTGILKVDELKQGYDITFKFESDKDEPLTIQSIRTTIEVGDDI